MLYFVETESTAPSQEMFLKGLVQSKEEVENHSLDRMMQRGIDGFTFPV